jgi:hypothetical protein
VPTPHPPYIHPLLQAKPPGSLNPDQQRKVEARASLRDAVADAERTVAAAQ